MPRPVCHIAYGCDGGQHLRVNAGELARIKESRGHVLIGGKGFTTSPPYALNAQILVQSISVVLDTTSDHLQVCQESSRISTEEATQRAGSLDKEAAWDLLKRVLNRQWWCSPLSIPRRCRVITRGEYWRRERRMVSESEYITYTRTPPC